MHTAKRIHLALLPLCSLLLTGCSHSPKPIKADDLCIEVRQASSLAAESLVLLHLRDHGRITRPYFHAYGFEGSDQLKDTVKSLKKERGETADVEQSRQRILSAATELHQLFQAIHDRQTTAGTEAQAQSLNSQLLHEKERLCKS